MEEQKKEIINMSDSRLEKLDVSRGEEITELYVRNNMLTELDLTNNKRIEKLDCTGNPLKFISALAPGCEGRFHLDLEAGKGGYVGLKIEPGLQQYVAQPEEGYEFEGWYNELGDRLSKEPVWNDTYGASSVIVAWFREKNC